MDKGKVVRWTDMTKDANKVIEKPEPDYTEALTDVMGRLQVKLATMQLGRASGWLMHADRWLNSTPDIRTLLRGQIVEVELGVNFTGEMSYRHPCIVLQSTYNWAVILPMTSKKYGYGILVNAAGVAAAPADPHPQYRNQLDFTAPGTLRRSSTVVEQIRMINKGRIIEAWKDPISKKPTRVPNYLLDAIDGVVTRMLVPSANRAIHSKDEEIRKLELENARLRAQLEIARAAATVESA